jgi:hypothetical protein
MKSAELFWTVDSTQMNHHQILSVEDATDGMGDRLCQLNLWDEVNGLSDRFRAL